MSMYVRVKRARQTFFLLVEPSETVLELKQKVQSLTDKPVEQQRLLVENVVMEDAKTLADLKVENDAIIAVTFSIESAEAGEDGEKMYEWEPIHIETLDGPEGGDGAGDAAAGEAAAAAAAPPPPAAEEPPPSEAAGD